MSNVKLLTFFVVLAKQQQQKNANETLKKRNETGSHRKIRITKAFILK